MNQSLDNTAVSDFGLFARLSLPNLQHTQIPSSHVEFCVYYYSSYGQIACSVMVCILLQSGVTLSYSMHAHFIGVDRVTY